MKRWLFVSLMIGLMAILPACGGTQEKRSGKPSPDKAVEILKEGNRRFVRGQPQRPHLSPERIIKAGRESQNDHAYATILSCSDSRVPVEHIFDAGIMDLFVVRVAGNVANTDEIGSIEYGLAHVKTPVLVVLGHTQCCAVTAVTEALHGHGHALERNIPPLVNSIETAVRRAQERYPHLKEKEVIPYAIEENVWLAMENLFMKSPAVREIVKEGRAKVVGAIYNVGTGEISWLPEARVTNILNAVESDPDRETEAMAIPAERKEKEKGPE